MTDIKKIIDVLASKPCIMFAYLFGSRVKGNVNERSDWDIAVYFSDPPEKMKGWPVFELEAELSQKIEATVQVIALDSRITPLLGYQIIAEGKLLMDRNEDIRLDIENRILRQYFDWQYFQNRHRASAYEVTS